MCVSDGDCAQDSADFIWDDYLEETGSVSVPHHAFKHVGIDLHGQCMFLSHHILTIIHIFFVRNPK